MKTQERKRETEVRETRTEDRESCHVNSSLFVFLYISDSNKCFKCSLDSLCLSLYLSLALCVLIQTPVCSEMEEMRK